MRVTFLVPDYMDCWPPVEAEGELVSLAFHGEPTQFVLRKTPQGVELTHYATGKAFALAGQLAEHRKGKRSSRASNLEAAKSFLRSAETRMPHDQFRRALSLQRQLNT